MTTFEGTTEKTLTAKSGRGRKEEKEEDSCMISLRNPSISFAFLASFMVNNLFSGQSLKSLLKKASPQRHEEHKGIQKEGFQGIFLCEP